jgi:dynein assembly factor 3, axonemal
LFLTLVCETGISQRERMEIFLDIMGNALLRDKSAEYLENVTKELIQLITEDDKCTSMIKELVNFETLKFKERDEIEDIFSSYYKAHPFDIEQLRD